MRWHSYTIVCTLIIILHMQSNHIKCGLGFHFEAWFVTCAWGWYLLLLIFLLIFLPTVFSCYTSSRLVDSETHVIFLCQLNGIIRDEYSYKIDLYHIYVEICSILILASPPSISSGAGNRCKMGPLYLPQSWRSIFSVSNINMMPYNIHASFAKVSFKNWQPYTSHLIFFKFGDIPVSIDCNYVQPLSSLL